MSIGSVLCRSAVRAERYATEGGTDTRKRVLVADDEPLTAELFALVLAFNGYEVVEAHDGREALERARAERPDVVLLDVVMPRLAGPEVVRRLTGRCDRTA